MKNLLPFVLLLFTMTAQAQVAKPAPEREQSKLELFSAKSGSLLEKRFEPVGKVRDISVEVYTITDMISNAKASGLRFETYIAASYGGSTKTAVLDADEVDGLIKSISLMQSNVFPTTKDAYTEINYQSRSGFKAGAYYSNSKWTAFVDFEKFSSNSSVSMKPDDFNELLILLQKAKEKLK